MTDTYFDKILEILNQIHEEYPTLRLGQVLQGAVDHHFKSSNRDLHDISSKQLHESMVSFHKHLQSRGGNK